MAPSFSSHEDALLIEQIKKNAALYDQKTRDYKDLVIKENIWNLIASTLGRSNEDCKTRWKHMRDNYFKLKRKQKMGTRYSSIRPTKWPLFRHLTFLNNAKQERRSSSNQDPSDDLQNDPLETSHATGEDGNGVEAEPIGSQKRKTANNNTTNSGNITDWCTKKLKTYDDERPETPESKPHNCKPAIAENLESKQRLPETSKRPEEDDVDLFMKSIAIVIKRMSPYSIARAKTDILAIVTKLQFPTSNPSCDNENGSDRNFSLIPPICTISTPASSPPRNHMEYETQ